MNIQNKTARKSKTRRAAFTLIELLVVISAIAVLASLAVGMMTSAQEDSRVGATRARIQIIQKMMETELEDYEARRSPVPFRNLGALVSVITARNQWIGTPENLTIHARNLKRMITLDLIRAEMPDFRDGVSANLGSFPTPQFLQYLQSDLQLTNADITNVVGPVFRGAATGNVLRWNNWGDGDAVDPDEAATNSAEVLYRILADLDVDGTSGLDVIGNAAIGDTDGDTFPEIIDAWGEPIAFEFQQRILVPVELEMAPPSSPAPSMRSGVWAEYDNTANPNLVPRQRMTDFFPVLPVLPSDIRFFVSSERLLEIDGQPTDFVSSTDINGAPQFPRE